MKSMLNPFLNREGGDKVQTVVEPSIQASGIELIRNENLDRSRLNFLVLCVIRERGYS